MRWARGRGAVLAGAAALAVAGCGGEDGPGAPEADSLEAKLAEAYRIDVSEIEVTYDYWPLDSRIQGRAVLSFEMRPGQSRPLFHFNPLRRSSEPEGEMLTSLSLDGEALDPYDNADLRRVRPFPSSEPAFEVQREVEAGSEHTLEVSWSVPRRDRNKRARGWFYSNFDDTVGPRDETETWWPTVSSPDELARHRIRLRVHASRPYTVLGSGEVRRQDASGVQAWEIHTERPVPSHTVLFAAIPSDEVRTARFRASGVDVRMVSDRAAGKMRRAEAIARRTITRLVEDFGPFPMPNMEILLTGWGSGMEYYGATRTGFAALEHELVHMYFGTTVVERTWRDIWFDEAAVVWWLRQDRLAPLPKGFSSEVATGRSAVEPGFDLAAYGTGARILGEIAAALGGTEEMLAFMAELHRRRAFEPFTTDEFIDDVLAAQEEIDRAQLERWLYGRGKAPTES